MAPPAAHPTTLFVRKLASKTTKDDLTAHFSGIGPIRRTILVTHPETGLCKGIAFIHYALPEDAATALKTLDGSLLHSRRISLDQAQPRTRTVGKDADGGLVPRQARPFEKQSKKRPGILKGSFAMRTVLLRRVDPKKNPQPWSETEARDAFSKVPKLACESVVLSAGGQEARCIFASWADAGKAAAAAHGGGIDACIEALRGGNNTELIVRNLPFKVDMAEMRTAFSKFAPVRELRLAPSRGLKIEIKEGGDGVVACGGYGFVEYFLVADAKYALQKSNGTKIGGRVIAVDLAMERKIYVNRVEKQEEDANEEEVLGAGGKKQSKPGGKDADEQDSESDSDDDGSSDSEEESVEEKKVAGNDGNRNQAKSKVMPPPEKKRAMSTTDEMTRTVFVRNLLFETSAPELWNAMESEFGVIEQAVLVMDRVTHRPRGTAFVRFTTEEDADKAVARGAAGDTSKSRSALEAAGNQGFILQGRPLLMSKAVNRSKATDLTQQARAKEVKKDPRNVRLAWIGQIKAGTPEAKGLSAEDISRRTQSAKDKKANLERNPNAFVSEVRLCVRNLPRDFDEKALKHLFLVSCQGMKKNKKHKPAADGEPSEGIKSKEPLITHCSIARDSKRNDRSKGYGFVQFEMHDHALAALHCTNNNPKALDMLIKARPKALKIDEYRERLFRKQWGDSRRLQVEFAVDDMRTVQLLERIKEKGRKIKEANKLKKQESGEGKKKSKKAKQKKKPGSEIGEDGQAEKKVSKSERNSAVKRKRADPGDEAKPNTASTERMDKGRDQGPSKKRKKMKKTVEEKTPTPAAPKAIISKRSTKYNYEEFEDPRIAEKSDAKPKKPRKKRKVGEMEQDAKLDSLVQAYKRKLEKGVKKGGAGKDSDGQGFQSTTTSRWFD